MKYFIDTEFIEGFHKPLFGKRRHFIDLISIGIVAEDGRTYYAISKEFNPKDADKWVKENVITKLGSRYEVRDNGGLEAHLDKFDLWKSNKQIAEEIVMFVYPTISWQFEKEKTEFLKRSQQYGWIANQPEFYGYYADYDWVLFCSLFGRMIDLPKGFPMYCRDLKQMLDEKANILLTEAPSSTDNMEGALGTIKRMATYPSQTDEHNALADAKWNYELYKFLTK